MAVVFELTAIEHCIDKGKSLAYPLPLFLRRLGLFSTRGRAERYLREIALEGDDQSLDIGSLIYFSLRELSLDRGIESYSLHTYLPDGRLYGEEDFSDPQGPRSFQGRPAASFRFQLGDFVQFAPSIDPKHLHLGIVTGLPLTTEEVADRQQHNLAFKLDLSDDVYLIQYFDDDGVQHDHLSEARLFTPSFQVDETLKTNLRALWIPC